MITTALTGVIAAVLAFFGIPPGPYLAGVWIAIKLVIVGIGVLIGLRLARRKEKGPKALDFAEVPEHMRR